MVETVNFGGDFAFVRKNTALSDAYAGPNGAISLDTEGKNVRVHNGATQGGAFTLPSLEGMGGWPTIHPSLDLKFSAKCIDPRLVVTRASTATYFDALGNIKTAAANEPRISYDPETGECIGLQIESAATNLIKYSEDISNAFWDKVNISFGASIISPSGSAMPLVIATSTDGSHSISTGYIDAAASTRYTFSCIVKPGGYKKVRVRVGEDVGAGYIGSIKLDASTGIVFFSDTPYRVNKLGSGLFLIEVSFTTSASATAAAGTVSILDDLENTTFAGDGISGIYVTSAQLELGQKATSRIKTTGAAATRAADVINMQGAGWLSSTEGTILVDAVIDYQATSVSQTLWTLDNGTLSNRMRAQSYASGNDKLLVVTQSGSTVAELLESSTASGQHRYAAAYGKNDFAATRDGGTVKVDTSGTPPTVTQLFIGSHRGTEDFMIGHIKRLAYWPKRLTNAELKRISL